MTTLFWVGEPSNADNDFIPNDVSYWDQNWQANYGGVDAPERRRGHWPGGFIPKENPFYVALPFGEFIRGYELKPKVRSIPWYRPGLSPVLKNRWVEIRRRGRSCYAQWEDSRIGATITPNRRSFLLRYGVRSFSRQCIARWRVTPIV